jgi:CubicO group peptidase (beta-lactamase class C family)
MSDRKPSGLEHQIGRVIPRIRLWFILAAALTIPAPAQPEKSAPDFSAVESLMQSRVAAGVPSIAIAVAHHGQIIWERTVGMSDRQRGLQATSHTPYYLASISKTITATALMELAEAGKVDLDRPVNDYLGAAKVSSPMWDVSQATVRRVANHTAGFATYDRDCRVDAPGCDASPASAIRRYGVIVWPPGKYFDYSNMSYGVLGEAVAHVSGTDLATALRQMVFAPLGMTGCTLDPSSDGEEPAAARYDSSPPFPPTPSKRSTAPGASSVYCSVHDLVRFGMFHLKDRRPSQKRILSDRAIETMQAASLDPSEESQYGLSWWVQNDLNGFKGVLAQGGTSDATAYLQLIPSEDLAVAMLWNTGTPNGARLVDQVLAAALPQYRKNLERTPVASQQPPSAPPATVPPGLIAAWSGYVQTYLGRVPLILTIDLSGALVAKLGAEPEVRVPHPRFGDGVIRWTMPGSLGVESEPFDLAMRLHLYNGVLAGAARTAPKPQNRDGSWASYWVRLEKGPAKPVH